MGDSAKAGGGHFGDSGRYAYAADRTSEANEGPAIELHLGDIAQQNCDAIVSSICPSLRGGGEIDRMVQRSGGPILASQIARIREERLPEGLPISGCVVTSAGRLDANWVIHAAGPLWQEGPWAPAALRATYDVALETAAELGARVVAMPALCVGGSRYPVAEAAEIAVAAARAATGIRRVRFVLSNRMTFLAYVLAFAGEDSAV